MKATGIVRRIDDLGRVVVPKEIRRTLRIREGDPLEIFTDREGSVILKKYSPIADLGEFAQEYADSLYEATRHIVLIADQDEVVAVAGASKKSFYERRITEHVEEVMRNRKPFLSNNANENPPISSASPSSITKVATSTPLILVTSIQIASSHVAVVIRRIEEPSCGSRSAIFR